MDFIQISDRSRECFSLTVTIHSISGLFRVFGDVKGPMWLSYKLFGVLVQTEQFEMGSPAFPPIRDVFKLRGSPSELLSYFQAMPRVDIFLCCPGVVLASTVLPLLSLLPTSGPEGEDFIEQEVSCGLVLRPISQELAQASAGGDALVHGTLQLTRVDGTSRRDAPVTPEAVDKSDHHAWRERCERAEAALSVKSREVEEAARLSHSALDEAQRRQARLSQEWSEREKTLQQDVSTLRERCERAEAALSVKSREVEEAARLSHLALDEAQRRQARLSQEWSEREKTLQHDMLTLRERCERAEADFRVKQDTLSAEWADREKARVRDLLAAQENYTKLEIRLRKTLAEAERRDAANRLAAAEKEQALAMKSAELDIARRRLKDECDCCVKLEQARARAVSERLEEALSDLNSRKAREKLLEDELFKLKEKEVAIKTPRVEAETALVRQLEQVRAELKDKEAQNETQRVQMIRLAKELARMRQEERERSQRELEKLKVEYLAREGRYVLDGDRATLRDIRQQLENLGSRE